MDFLSGSIFWVLTCSVKCVGFCSDITLGLVPGFMCLQILMLARYDVARDAEVAHGRPSERLVRIWRIRSMTEVLHVLLPFFYFSIFRPSYHATRLPRGS